MQVEVEKKILVVDDDATNRLVVRVLMELRGHTVVEAASGHDALDIIEATDFDVILMDLSMPQMDGFETTLHMRKGKHCGSYKPIFALTAHTDRSNFEKCMKAGMNGVLGKPFDSGGADQILTLLNSPTSHSPS
ncbi:response regulator [Rhodobacteraceae bacterium N5(2021)]|uniref:Response regulator n=1 Tax=Gymnodinialimonas phycosphaerae TaxID=2841589 RepID=A0A975TSB6_9RHOB|nr:response regulator [Gymnodinialimonas phycosphaerae]MBY4893883.1 response regulator [Gymnodinialimonas phycosphaerae]